MRTGIFAVFVTAVSLWLVSAGWGHAADASEGDQVQSDSAANTQTGPDPVPLNAFLTGVRALSLMKASADVIGKCSTDIGTLYNTANLKAAVTLTCDCKAAKDAAKKVFDATQQGADPQEFIKTKIRDVMNGLDGCLRENIEAVEQYAEVLGAGAMPPQQWEQPSVELRIRSVRAGDLRFPGHHCAGQVPENWIRAQCKFGEASTTQPYTMAPEAGVLGCQIPSAKMTVPKICGGKNPSPEGKLEVEIIYDCGPESRRHELLTAAGGDVAIICPAQ